MGWRGRQKEKEKGRDRKRAEFIAHKNKGAKVWKIQEGMGVKEITRRYRE